MCSHVLKAISGGLNTDLADDGREQVIASGCQLLYRKPI